MRLPRALSADEVVGALGRLGFAVLRQAGSHIRLGKGSCRVTVPNHKSIAPGTLKSILRQAGLELEKFVANPPATTSRSCLAMGGQSSCLPRVRQDQRSLPEASEG